MELYLLISVIHREDDVYDFHELYESLDDAKNALNKEIKRIQKEYFYKTPGETVTITDRYKEWHDESGFGYYVYIDKVKVN